MTDEAHQARKLIDTSVLVYAYESSDAEKHGIAASLLSRLHGEEGGASVSVQNLAEFCRVVCERLSPPLPHDKAALCVEQLSGQFAVVNYGEQTVIAALSLSSTYGIHFFDALLAATMQENYISEIITENSRDFAKIPGLRVTNPFRKK